MIGNSYEDPIMSEACDLRAEVERLRARLAGAESDPVRCPRCETLRLEMGGLRARLAEAERERDAAWSVARAHEVTMDGMRARSAKREGK